MFGHVKHILKQTPLLQHAILKYINYFLFTVIYNLKSSMAYSPELKALMLEESHHHRHWKGYQGQQHYISSSSKYLNYHHPADKKILNAIHKFLLQKCKIFNV